MVDEFVLHCVRADAPPTTQCKFSAVTLGGPASKVERGGILCCLDPRAHFCRGRLLPLIVLATDTKYRCDYLRIDSRRPGWYCLGVSTNRACARHSARPDQMSSIDFLGNRPVWAAWPAECGVRMMG